LACFIFGWQRNQPFIKQSFSGNEQIVTCVPRVKLKLFPYVGKKLFAGFSRHFRLRHAHNLHKGSRRENILFNRLKPKWDFTISVMHAMRKWD